MTVKEFQWVHNEDMAAEFQRNGWQVSWSGPIHHNEYALLLWREIEGQDGRDENTQ